MATAYDSARLEALSAELDLLEGPFSDWKRLPFKRAESSERDDESDESDDEAAKPAPVADVAGQKSADVEGRKEVMGVVDGEDADEQEDEDIDREDYDDEDEEHADEDMEDEEDWEDEDDDEDDYDEEGDETYCGMNMYDLRPKIVQRILEDLCTLVHNSQDCSDFDELLSKAEMLIDQGGALDCATARTAMSKSWAHSDERPMLESKPFAKGMGNFWQEIGKMLEAFMAESLGRENINSLEGSHLMNAPKPWSESFRPHPLSTKFARFKDDVEITPTHEQPTANAIYTARCEVVKSRIRYPCFMELSSDAEIIMHGYVGGYKNRTSLLNYHVIEEGTDEELPRFRSFEGQLDDPGHADHFRYQCFEESRKLFFTAEWTRIKSFQWAPVGGGALNKWAMPVHTFNSAKWDGPIVGVAAGEGKLIRAGKGSAGVWNLDTAPTHGESGKDRIGDVLDKKNTWRDDPEYIEDSAGSPHDSTITFEDPDFKPSIWEPHPSQPGVMLAGEDFARTKSFAFRGLDLETGKIVQRYLGHGGAVQQISTVEGQPQTFTTACLDGLVRLWDTRTPLPVLSIRVGLDGCLATAYANPDGIPTIFTGAGQEEQIRLWDVRALTPVYELATGNNAVQSLAWDSKRNQLWAATTADSRMHGYRQAKVPPGQESHWDDGKRWPTRAYHFEDYFGTMYDSNGSLLIRYAFKEEPDPTRYPIHE